MAVVNAWLEDRRVMIKHVVEDFTFYPLVDISTEEPAISVEASDFWYGNP